MWYFNPFCDSASESCTFYFCTTFALQSTCTFAEGVSRGDDVINKQNPLVFCVEVLCYPECTFDVRCTFASVNCVLWFGVTGLYQSIFKGDPEH